MDPREYQFVFFGILVVWLVVAAYVVSLGMRERKLRQELDRVKRMVEKS